VLSQPDDRGDGALLDAILDEAEQKGTGRWTAQDALELGIPAPAFSSALAYYDGLRAERLPAALIQGLRDLFGAHTYRRVDRDGVFHTQWSSDRAEVSGD